MIERRAVDLAARLAPWLATVPTAYLVYARTVEYLAWPLWVGIVAGLTLELLGLAIMVTALSLWAYNREKRKSDPAASLVLPVVLVALYFVAAELLTVLLDTLTTRRNGVADWAPAVFPVLSVAAMAVLALRADHERRVQGIAESKAEARAARLRRRNETQTVAHRIAEPESETQPDAPPEFQTKTEHVRWLAENNGHMTRTQIAEVVGCAPSTVTRALAKAEG